MRKDILQQIADRTKKFEQHYGEFGNKKKVVKEMSVREMLGVVRKALNEDDAPRAVNQTEIDREQEKMLNYFADDNVDIQFEPLQIYPNGVFLSGSIDGQLLFAYKVAPEEKDSGVEVKYLDGFDPSDPDNDKVIKKVQAYYNDFYKYWRDNELQLSGA